MNYIIYNESGDILRTGRCKPQDFKHQVKDGEYIIEGVADTLLDRVVDGVVKKKTKAKISKIKNERAMAEVRLRRDAMLSQTDWTQMPDSPLSDEMKNRYKQYRQALRDLPQNYGTINELSDVTFPTIEDF